MGLQPSRMTGMDRRRGFRYDAPIVNESKLADMHPLVYEVTLLTGAFGWPEKRYTYQAGVESIVDAAKRDQDMVRIPICNARTGFLLGHEVVQTDKVREIVRSTQGGRETVFVNPRSTAPQSWEERPPEQLGLC